MTITRYNIGTRHHNGIGFPGEMVKQADGEYVRHADCLESLHEAERQIAALTEDYADMAAKNAELERQLEAIGAGGVSLMGDAKDAEIVRLREVSQAVSDSLTLYERYGEVCPFEGEPMIHASTLVALGELARAAITQQEQA